MAAIALRTELDVAEVLLEKGWLPEEINSVLVFPLPGAAFCCFLSKNCDVDRRFSGDDVIKATFTTPSRLHRARHLLLAAGWLEQELNSLLKPCLCSVAPWRSQTLPVLRNQPSPPWLRISRLSVSLQQYRRTMAVRRLGSLGLVIMGVVLSVILAS